MNNNHDSGTDTGTDHSPSRFTAVNGRDTVPAGHPLPSASQEERGIQSGAESTPDSSREKVAGQNDPGQGDRVSRGSSPPAHSTHKRKRSGSRESRRDSEGYSAGRGPHRPGEYSATPSANGAGPGSVSEMEPGSAAAPSGPQSDNQEAPGSTNGPWPDYDTQLVNQAQRAQHIDASDAHLVDALQRDSHAHRPASSAPSVQPASSPVYSERGATTVQVAPKRKRVFSNRTKTGCMTCRRRKKKCDEQHPACNNCIRGGFLCEGYTSRSTWQKPSSSKAPVPLQSKDGYPDVSAQYLPDAAPHHDPPGSIVEHLDSRKMRPIVAEENERPAPQYSSSPTGPTASHTSWTKRSWTGPNHHAPYVTEQMPKPDYPSIHELSRSGPPKHDYHQVVPSMRELPHGLPPKSSMPLFHSAVEPRPLPTPTMDTSSPQAQARMALSIEHQLSHRTMPGNETEKEKMIKGELYRPFDVQLVEDRDRCKRALWRFNNACNPISGLSSKEQNRLLKDILVPPSDSMVNSPSGGAMPRGSIGQGAVVEAPFTCHYGYNIKIGEDVMISHGCLFVDDCGIQVRAHTWIGPNVTILSSSAHPNMQERKGSQSRLQGREIIIEEDCYIGAGCTIYPGIVIQRGAYIAPGQIITQHIKAYTINGERPLHMV
ncbi:Maltose/galactoside acetyltransferase [Penicillium capsulatum]|nr:Maltose/galactoside acetyltransferase [Penicillium capsulatum]